MSESWVQLAVAQAQAKKLAYAYRRLQAAVLGVDPATLDLPTGGTLTPELERGVLARVSAARQRAESVGDAWAQVNKIAHAYRRLQAAVLDVHPATLDLPDRDLTRDAEREAIAHVRNVRVRAEDVERATRRLTKLAYAYRRLQATALDVDPTTLDLVDIEDLTMEVERPIIAAVHRKAQAVTLEGQLALGRPFEDSVIDVIRDQLKRGRHVHARSMAQALQLDSRTRRVGKLAEALVAMRLNLHELAMAKFAGVPLATIARLAPREYSAAAAHSAPEALGPLAEHLLAGPILDVDAAIWVLKYQVGLHDPASVALRDRLMAVPYLVDRDAATLGWLNKWVDRIAEPDNGRALTSEAVTFGVLTYDTPDRTRTSSNMGDYIQTVAASSHIVCRRGLSFVGDPGLAQAFTELADRVCEDAVQGGPERTVRLVEVSRDASHLNSIPPNTWALAYGWYAHLPFGLLPDFPFHHNVNPIFVSFHVNHLEILTPEAVEYLKQYAPIGCRDWNTVYLLKSAGIPAFFSGCITTTIGSLFPDVPADPSKPVAYVDSAPPEDEPQAIHVTQAYEAVRDRNLAENIREAVRLIGSYQTDFSRVVTSRLHCYLPSWASGVDVEFRPHRRVDVRFNGLLDATEQERNEMRDRITGLLRPTIDAIIGGRPREEVYQLWRRITSEEVERADERYQARHPLPGLPFDIDRAVAKVYVESSHRPACSDSERTGDVVHVAIAVDGNLKQHARTVVAGLVDNSDRPIHLYVLCREHDRDDKDALEALFPEIAVTWLPCDHIEYGTITGMLTHITVSTMDRLMLPYLLPPAIEKVVYHDIDALTLGDIGELYEVRLGDAPLAARDAPNWKVRLGVRTSWAATMKMTTDPAIANDYLLRLAQTVPFEFTLFNAGIMVLNLTVMRKDRFGEEFLPWVSMYGLNDQQLLNIYANRRRVPLRSKWNALPAQEAVGRPALIHWAGHAKPWMPDYIAGKEYWLAAEHRVADRAVKAASRRIESP